MDTVKAIVRDSTIPVSTSVKTGTQNSPRAQTMIFNEVKKMRFLMVNLHHYFGLNQLNCQFLNGEGTFGQEIFIHLVYKNEVSLSELMKIYEDMRFCRFLYNILTGGLYEN